jgi:hypothetical protein
MKSALVGFLFLIVSSISSFAGELDFTLVNETGFAITNVFISPNTQKEWGEDVMGKDVLEDGGSVDIKFSPKEDEAVWDIKVTDKEGNEVFWEDIDLTKCSKITLHYNDNAPTATFE